MTVLMPGGRSHPLVPEGRCRKFAAVLRPSYPQPVGSCHAPCPPTYASFTRKQRTLQATLSRASACSNSFFPSCRTPRPSRLRTAQRPFLRSSTQWPSSAPRARASQWQVCRQTGCARTGSARALVSVKARLSATGSNTHYVCLTGSARAVACADSKIKAVSSMSAGASCGPRSIGCHGVCIGQHTAQWAIGIDCTHSCVHAAERPLSCVLTNRQLLNK